MKDADEMRVPAFYSVTPATVRYSKKLSSGAKLLYGEITALVDKRGYCWASNKYFSDLYDKDARTITRWIGELKSAGFITVEVDKLKGNFRKIFLKSAEDPAEDPIDKNVDTIDKNVYTPIDKNVVTHIKYNINTREEDFASLHSAKKTTEVDKEKSRKKKPCPLPTDFLITPEMRKWAGNRGWQVNLDSETEVFMDHHLSKGSKFADWVAAWRTWITRANTIYKPKYKVREKVDGKWDH